MRQLPHGWTSAELGDVISGFETGRNFKASSTPAQVGEYGVLKISAVTWGRFQPGENKALLEGDAPFPHELVRAGDLLISRANTTELVGAPVLVDQDYRYLMLPDKILRLLYDERVIEPRFLLYALRTQTARAHIEANATGTSDSMRNLSQPKLRGIPLALAPLSQQKRIADKLDALLARVDACRKCLDRVPIIIKRFRQAVLAAATSGELTREWREERRLGAYLDSWETSTVEHLIREKPRNGYSPRAVERPTPVKSLTLTATTTGRFRGENFKYIDEEIPQNSHLWLAPGDILIQRANTLEYVGVSAIFDGKSSTFIYPDLMMKCRANDRVLTKFLWCVLSSVRVRQHFRNNATGTAGNMPKINQQTVLSAPAMVPPLDEQREIVRRVDTLLLLGDELERRHRSALRPAQNLTAALLAKGFRGELVPQDMSDEPASELLARIQTRSDSPGKRGKPKPSSTREPRTKAKAEASMLTRKDVSRNHLTTILKERGALTAEALWSASQLDIDEFYDQLKDEEARGLLRENRGDRVSAPRLLEPAA